jgi:hypothetical protein
MARPEKVERSVILNLHLHSWYSDNTAPAFDSEFEGLDLILLPGDLPPLPFITHSHA